MPHPTLRTHHASEGQGDRHVYDVYDGRMQRARKGAGDRHVDAPAISCQKKRGEKKNVVKLINLRLESWSWSWSGGGGWSRL